ncbi:MFS transporter [Candidatus Pacearchaeota archaeon]|nr:MFS transporter [Candidatus Pacearchaeota archaeon]
MKFTTKVKSLRNGMEFTHGIRRALMGTLGLIYFLSFGFNIISVTTLFSISTLIMLFFEFPTGAIADYDSRKKSIMISFILMAIAFFGLFFFKGFWLLAGSWILGDIAWTFYSGAGGAWSIDALNIGKKKSKIVSLISKGYFFEKGGHIIGGLIGLIVVSINFSYIWLFVSVSNLFMFFIVAKYMEERNFTPEKVSHNYLMKSIIKAKESFKFLIHEKNKQLRVLIIGNFLGVFAISVFFIGMPLLFTEILSLNPGQLSGITSIVAALTIISPIIAGKIAQTKGIKNSMIISIFIVSVSIIVFAFSQSIIIAVIAFAILQLSIAAVDVMEDSAYHHEFDSKIRASLGSLSNVIWAIGFSISVFLAGISISFFGVVPTLVISGLLVLLEAIIYIFGLKK